MHWKHFQSVLASLPKIGWICYSWVCFRSGIAPYRKQYCFGIKLVMAAVFLTVFTPITSPYRNRCSFATKDWLNLSFFSVFSIRYCVISQSLLFRHQIKLCQPFFRPFSPYYHPVSQPLQFPYQRLAEFVILRCVFDPLLRRITSITFSASN